MASRRCIWCGGTNLTKEHGFPNWLNNVFAPPEDNYTVQSVSQLRDLPERTVRFASRRIDHRLGVCCGTCNSGWMARLEDRAKPILSVMVAGAPIELAAADQLLIATWLAKTCAVLEQTSPAPAFDREQLDAISQRQQPPSRCTAKLAAYDGDAGPVRYLRAHGRVTDGADAGSVGSSTVIILGQLIMLLTVSPHAGYQTLSRPPVRTPAVFAIWPPYPPSISWPPPLRVDERGAVELLTSDLPPESVRVDDLLDKWRLIG